MRYTRKHDLLVYVVGIGGFIGLLLAGSVYAPGEVWLRGAALVWFLGFGLVRCLALLTLPRERASGAGAPSDVEGELGPRSDAGAALSPAQRSACRVDRGPL